MALNLVRNSRVFFTTNVNSSTGVIITTGFTAANTQEIQVLDGFTFSQNTNADVITISEAGVAPVRGQRSFNTSLAPVDFSFSTYVRPFNATTAITAEESVLWNAMFSAVDYNATASTLSLAGTIGSITYAFSNTTGTGTLTIPLTSGTLTTGATVGDIITISGFTAATGGALNSFNAPALIKSYKAGGASITTGAVPATGLTELVLEYVNPTVTATSAFTLTSPKLYRGAWAPIAATQSIVTAASSNLNQLLKFGMFFAVDNVVYQVDNCAMNQVMIDFGLDAIATLQWTGQATKLTESAVALSTITATAGTSYTAKITTAPFITNKLSTVAFTTLNALGSAAATTYTIALTGGSVTINNNISYITPANLGVVNVPAVYYTGTRSITGTINAYLKTGSGVGSTGQLLSDMLAAASASVEPIASVSLAIGGSTNSNRVVLEMPAVTFTVPSVDVQQVISTAINFTAEGYVPNTTANANTFALDETNDLTVRYFAA